MLQMLSANPARFGVDPCKRPSALWFGCKLLLRFNYDSQAERYSFKFQFHLHCHHWLKNAPAKRERERKIAVENTESQKIRHVCVTVKRLADKLIGNLSHFSCQRAFQWGGVRDIQLTCDTP